MVSQLFLPTRFSSSRAILSCPSFTSHLPLLSSLPGARATGHLLVESGQQPFKESPHV